jgi:hypothetical protein
MPDFIGTGFTEILDADDPRVGAGLDGHVGERIVLVPSGVVLVKTGTGSNDWALWTSSAGALAFTDKNLTPAAMGGLVDDFDTGLTLAAAPDGYVGVFLNRAGPYRLAQSNAERAASAFYFGTVAGTALPPPWTAGLKLFYNGLVAGVLLDALDRIDLVYET